MKPLPKLDLVMLWMARLYALFVLVSEFVRLISYANEPDRLIITHFSGAPNTTGYSTVTEIHSGPTQMLFVHVLLCTVLLIGLLMLNRKFAQVAVIVAAVFSAGMSLYGIFHFIYLAEMSNAVSRVLAHNLFFKILVGCACNLVVQAGNVWLALKSPFGSEKSGDADHRSFAAMQPS